MLHSRYRTIMSSDALFSRLAAVGNRERGIRNKADTILESLETESSQRDARLAALKSSEDADRAKNRRALDAVISDKRARRRADQNAPDLAVADRLARELGIELEEPTQAGKASAVSVPSAVVRGRINRPASAGVVRQPVPVLTGAALRRHN
jgi:hypothetical protein